MLQTQSKSKWGNFIAVIIGTVIAVLGLAVGQWFLGSSSLDQRITSFEDRSTTAYFDANTREFGWKFIPNVTTQVTRKKGNQIIYQATYTFDEYGRRTVREKPPVPKDKFLIWLGGSVMMGEGLNNQETLDYQLTEQFPDLQSYNYAVMGYGLAHIMAQAENIDFSKQIPQREGVIIYRFPTFHIDRLIGGLQSIDWAGPIPYYKWIDGEIVRDGFLQEKQPLRTLAKKFFNKTFLRTKYHIEWPFNITKNDLEFACRVLAEVRDRIIAHFDQADFLLLLGENDLPLCLDKYKIQWLDLSKAFDGFPKDKLIIQVDGHPNGFANEILSAKIAEHLKKIGY